jgi:hypothetical protein
MKSISLVFLTLIVSSISWGQNQNASTINLTLEEYAQLVGKSQSGGSACFANMSQGASQSLSDSYDAYVNQSKTLMDNANKRYTTLKDCRQNLRQQWLEFQKSKNENLKEQNLLSIKIRKAESDYRLTLIKMQESCTQQANADFVKYKESVYGNRVVTPQQLVNFNNRINQSRTTFYEACYRSPLNVAKMAELERQLRITIDGINAEMKTSNDILASMTEQIGAIQKDIITDCENKSKLDAYNESITNQVASRGRSLAMQKNLLNMVSAISSCQSPKGTSGDTTTRAPSASDSNF